METGMACRAAAQDAYGWSSAFEHRRTRDAVAIPAPDIDRLPAQPVQQICPVRPEPGRASLK